MKSTLFAWTFGIAAVLYGAGVEAFCRIATGESTVTLLRAWLEKGAGRVVLPIVWLLATPAALAFIADHVRNVYVSLTGTPESYVFLGDRLREGFFAVREADPRGEPVFVPHFVAREQYPSATFGRVYLRRILLRDAEGNLTAAEALSTGKAAIFTVAQLFLILLSVGPWISIAGQFKSGFTVRGDLPQALNALALPAELVWGAVMLVGAGYLASIVAIAWPNREARGSGGDRVLPVPKVVREGAILEGTVIATEIFSIDNRDRDRQTHRYYKRYAIRFSGADFPQPVYLNWWAQRVHQGNISVTVGETRREREDQRDYYDRLFEYLDRALETGAAVRFQVSEEFGVVPESPFGSTRGER